MPVGLTVGDKDTIVPPQSGLCGVANAEYEVDDGLRTVAEVRPRLAELGLRQGTQEEFETWLDAARTGWRRAYAGSEARS